MSIVGRAQLVIELEIEQPDTCSGCGRLKPGAPEQDLPDFEEIAMQAQQGYFTMVPGIIADATVVFDKDCVDM